MLTTVAFDFNLKTTKIIIPVNAKKEYIKKAIIKAINNSKEEVANNIIDILETKFNYGNRKHPKVNSIKADNFKTILTDIGYSTSPIFKTKKEINNNLKMINAIFPEVIKTLKINGYVQSDEIYNIENKDVLSIFCAPNKKLRIRFFKTKLKPTNPIAISVSDITTDDSPNQYYTEKEFLYFYSNYKNTGKHKENILEIPINVYLNRKKFKHDFCYEPLDKNKQAEGGTKILKKETVNKDGSRIMEEIIVFFEKFYPGTDFEAVDNNTAHIVYTRKEYKKDIISAMNNNNDNNNNDSNELQQKNFDVKYYIDSLDTTSSREAIEFLEEYIGEIKEKGASDSERQ